MSLTFEQVEAVRAERGIPVSRWAPIVGLSVVYYRQIQAGIRPWNPHEATERSIRKAIGLPSPRYELYCKQCGGSVGDYCTSEKGHGQAARPRDGCPYWEMRNGMPAKKESRTA